ncbi:MAG: hypothetical protein HQK84_05815 [Nitrospinae bacterium]|nr:hypothetical protein [Nitrospinota bacterium]
MDEIPGLKKADWNLLRNAVLSAQFTDEYIKKIPQRLQEHPVAILIRKYRTTKYMGHLNKAAKLLAGGIANPWLYLEKGG